MANLLDFFCLSNSLSIYFDNEIVYNMSEVNNKFKQMTLPVLRQNNL